MINFASKLIYSQGAGISTAAGSKIHSYLLFA